MQTTHRKHGYGQAVPIGPSANFPQIRIMHISSVTRHWRLTTSENLMKYGDQDSIILNQELVRPRQTIRPTCLATMELKSNLIFLLQMNRIVIFFKPSLRRIMRLRLD